LARSAVRPQPAFALATGEDDAQQRDGHDQHPSVRRMPSGAHERVGPEFGGAGCSVEHLAAALRDRWTSTCTASAAAGRTPTHTAPGSNREGTRSWGVATTCRCAGVGESTRAFTHLVMQLRPSRRAAVGYRMCSPHTRSSARRGRRELGGGAVRAGSNAARRGADAIIAFGKGWAHSWNLPGRDLPACTSSKRCHTDLPPTGNRRPGAMTSPGRPARLRGRITRQKGVSDCSPGAPAGPSAQLSLCRSC